MDASRRAPERKNSEMYFVISSLSRPPQAACDSVPDITDFAPDALADIRDDIARVAQLLVREPLELRPPQRKLRLRTSEALAGVTGYLLPTERVLMLSASAMIADANEYPRLNDGRLAPSARMKFATTIRGRISSSLADTLVSRFDARVMDKLGPKAHAELGKLVADGLRGIRVRHDLAHVASLGDALLRPYRESLRLQFGCVAAGMHDDAKRVAHLTELCCAGNYPLGTMDDGTFLVLVE